MQHDAITLKIRIIYMHVLHVYAWNGHGEDGHRTTLMTNLGKGPENAGEEER